MNQQAYNGRFSSTSTQILEQWGRNGEILHLYALRSHNNKVGEEKDQAFMESIWWILREYEDECESTDVSLKSMDAYKIPINSSQTILVLEIS